MLQQKYRVARRNRDAAVVGIAFSGVMAIPTHGTSLFGLLFTIPRYVHYSRKLSTYRQRMLDEDITPLPRTKRDYALPLIMGAGSATLGTVLGDVGVTHTMGGSSMDTLVNKLMGAHAATDIARIFGDGPGEKVAEMGLGLIIDRLISPFNQMRGKTRSNSMNSTSSDYGPVLYDGVREMLLRWGATGNEKSVYETEEEFLNAVGRTEEEMLDAIANIDELIRQVMNSVFTEEELEIINRHLTEHAIFEVMRAVFSSAEYQGLQGDEDADILQLYFKHLVLSATKEIRRKKQVVQSIGEIVTATTPMTPKAPQRSEMALHYGIPCNSCEDLEIEGVRYNCTGCVGEDINYCYECFMKDENEEHVFQHKWIAFHTSSYDLTPASELIQLPLDDAVCSVCVNPVQEDRFNCRDCDQFDVCRDCFKAAGKTLHETHTFALISPFGYQLVDRDSYFSGGITTVV